MKQISYTIILRRIEIIKHNNPLTSRFSVYVDVKQKGKDVSYFIEGNMDMVKQTENLP